MAKSTSESNRRPAADATRLTGSDALRLHVTLASGLVLCVGAFTIELIRALGGHSFSWLYVFEWPMFAGFAIYMWWILLHGRDHVSPTSRRPLPPSSGERDPELDAWNIYLKVMEAAEEDDPERPR